MAQQTVVVDITLLGKMAGYIEILVKDPHSTAFAALSDIYRTFGLHEEAVAVAQKGSEMVPTYVPGFVALGRALAEKGDLVGASAAYHRALALDPVNSTALTGLASSCLGCGHSAEALVLLTRAQLIAPDDEVVKQLIPVVKKLVAILPPVLAPKIHDSFVLTPRQLPPAEKIAVEDEPADRSTDVAPLPPIATATLADIYIKQGFLERALKVLSDLLAVDPENTEIRLRYNALLQRVNDSALITPAAAAVVPPTVVVPVRRAAPLPEETGKEALVALYRRWLDAVNRRRADVH